MAEEISTKIDPAALEQLGVSLRGKFLTYEKDRSQLEQQWLTNLRQYRSVYDKEIADRIPEGRSKVYPKDTRTKIVGFVAKLMEMMFPATEKNWGLQPTPFPTIQESDLQMILDALTQGAVEAATAQYQQQVQEIQQQGGDPATVPPPDLTAIAIDPKEIEKAVYKFAETRAAQMEKECEDQLDDSTIDFPNLAKTVIRRAGIFGFGVVKGPMVKTREDRVWKQDLSGKYVAESVKVKRPHYVPRRVWDIYPDLSANTWAEQEGLFERIILPRHGLRALTARPGFKADVINEYLADHKDGNYKVRTYEGELNSLKHADNNSTTIRQFEIICWYGFVSGHELRAVGVEIPDSALGKEILADIWLLDDKIILADTAPFGENVADMYHVFIPEEDEDSALTGTGLPEVLRDSQLKLCSIDRATMDNMASVAGPIVEVNDDLLAPGEETKPITSFRTVHRIGDGADAQSPALRVYNVNTHIAELINLRQEVLHVFDVESNLPSWTMGNTQPLGEAFRTSNNMSMMTGGANMVTKDTVRAFDKFVKSLIGSLVRWNMEFSTRTDIKGDFQVMPKGSLSLVAKEVRGAALDQLSQTLTPRQAAMVKERKLLIDRFKSRDLPEDYVEDEKTCDRRLRQMDEAQAQAASVQQNLDQAKAGKLQSAAQKDMVQAQEIAKMVDVKVQEALSRIASNMAAAKGATDGSQLEALKLLLTQGGAQGTGEGTAAATSTAGANV